MEKRTPAIRVFNSFQDSCSSDITEYRAMTPEERLDLVERLRLEAGKLNYEYPARFRRVFTVTRKA
jgi:hypothetical protein